jgi:ubiquinone biosynthesis protein
MWAAIRLIRATWLFSWIFASYLLQLGLQKLFGRARLRARWKKVHRRNARRLFRGFVRLRGVYIKLGQILSIMGSFLPRAYTEELRPLQDEVPPTSYDQVARSIRKAFGTSPEELYASFERTPIAAASLGQVHEAQTHDGRRVAVKVLYPNVATIIKIDLRVLGWALRVYRWFVPVQQLERVHEQLRDMLERETDFLNEARCIKRMAANFADDPDVLFPEVDDQLTATNVLTMSFMDGVKIGRIEALTELGLEPNAVATKLVQVFYKQLFLDRFFHADPHPGNWFVQRGPEGQVRIVVLDLGAASEVSDGLADGMLQILTGLMSRDDDLVVRGIETMGFVAEHGNRALLERTTRKYFEKLLNLNITDFGRIGPEVAQRLADPEVKRDDLRELMKSIQYPLGWFYVERAVVIMFGLSSQLAPRLNTVQVGFPYIMQFVGTQAERQRAAAPPPDPGTDSGGPQATFN